MRFLIRGCNSAISLQIGVTIVPEAALLPVAPVAGA